MTQPAKSHNWGGGDSKVELNYPGYVNWRTATMFHMRRAGDLMILQSDLLPVSLKHAFTTRRPSQKSFPGREENNPNFRIDSIEQTAKWWVKLRDWLFTPKHTCYIHRQVHSGTVRVINPDQPEGDEQVVDGFSFRIPGEGDAIIRRFSRKPAFIAVTTADCLPCIAYDPESKIVGVLHAGWRGLAADIPGNMLRTFKSELDISPRSLFWAIGPSIDAANYEVGNEVIAALETAGYAEIDWQYSEDIPPGWTVSRRKDHYMVNLASLINMRLVSLGVPPSQIDTCNLSTYDNPNLFFSYRRDGEVKGLQATVIG